MEFVIYLIKVNIAIVLFYGIYRMLFQQDTFFQWKRLALLSVIFISFLYPAIDLTRQMIANHQLKNMLETVQIPVYTLPELVVAENVKAPVNLFPQIILPVYLLASGLLLIRMLFQLWMIAYKLRKTTKKVLFGQTVYESPEVKTPFSFFRWIVLDSSRYSEIELQEILLHETTHVKQAHSADTLLAELLCVLCWFNPFAWLLKTEIRMNLEFLADRSVLSSGCRAEHYQFHLLHLSYHKAAAKITNNFNVSLLKKRIFMMNKKQTSHRSIWKYALILPVIAMLLFFNCTLQSKTKPDNVTNNEQQSAVKVQDKPLLKDSVDIFTHVEVMPQFPGGEAALMKWLADNITYPPLAQEQGIQGRVNTRFVITPDGSIEDVEIVKGLDPSCDKEAIRVVKSMPKWVPGKQNGKAVYAYFSLPITFRLQNSDNQAKPSSQSNELTVIGYGAQHSQPATTSSQSGNTTDKLSEMTNVIIEINGKVVSDEELKNLDTKTIESFVVNRDATPNRIIITTKK